MRPILLIVEGLKNSNSHLFDFSRKPQSLILSDESVNALRDGLVFAFYGKQQNTEYSDEIKVDLQFDFDGNSYLLKRKVVGNTESLFVADIAKNIGNAYSDEKSFTEAMLNNTDDTTLFPFALKGKEAQSFLDNLNHYSVADFVLLYPICIDGMYSAIAENSSERNSMIAVMIDKYLRDTKKITASLATMKEKEIALKGKLELIRDVSKDELSGISDDVSKLGKALNDITIETAKIDDDLQKAEEYKAITEFLENAVKNLENISSKEEQIKSLTSKVTVSDKVKDIYPLYLKLEEMKGSLGKFVTSRNLAKENLDANNQKVSDGEISCKNFEKDFILNSEKIEELSNLLFGLVKDVSDNPKTVNIDAAVEHYYASKLQELANITIEKDSIDVSLKNLIEEFSTLEARKNKINITAEYKMAVNKGSFCEVKLGTMDSLAKTSAGIIENLKREIETLHSKKIELENKISKLNDKGTTKHKSILGGYKTYQEAMNVTTVYKQTLYSKHLLATNEFAEIYAIDEKLAKIKESNLDYQNKIAELNVAVSKVLEHKQKIFIRFEVLNGKLLDLVSYNQAMEVAEKTKYGEKCPFCDNNVFAKKALSRKDATELSEEIRVCQESLIKDDQKLDKLKTSIGEYTATCLISDQYMASLINTKNAKQNCINTCLSDCNVTTLDGLYELLTTTISRSNEMQIAYDAYRDINVEYRNSIAILETLNKQILFDQDKQKEEERNLDDIAQKIASLLNEYANYQPLLNGVNAVELLPKINVIEKEVESIVSEQSNLSALISAALAKQTVIDKAYTILKYKDFDVSINGIDYDYPSVIKKSYADKLEVYTNEISRLKEIQEDYKLKISALKKVVAATKAKAYENAQEYHKFNSKIEAITIVYDVLLKEIKSSFVSVGLQDTSAIASHILDDRTKDSYNSQIDSYNADLSNTIKQIQSLEEKEKELSVYNDNKTARLNEKLAYLDTAEKYKEAISNATVNHNVLKKMQVDFIQYSEEQNTLINKIKQLEDFSSIITNDTIVAKDLADKIFATADSLIYSASNGKYGIRVEDSVLLVNHQKDSKTKVTAEFNKEEAILVKISITSAINEVLTSLLNELFPIVLDISQEENTKTLEKVLTNFKNQIILRIK